MTKENKIIFGLLGISTLVIFGFGFLIVNNTQPPALNSSDDAKVEVLGATSHEWGEIDIEGGNVEKTFQIKNSGDSALEITNFKTSCMCTEVRVVIDDKSSPSFGMHSNSGWKGTVEPGQTADVQIVFDPMFHGPQGTGPITRLVSFNTNDSSKPVVEFKLAGDVVRK